MDKIPMKMFALMSKIAYTDERKRPLELNKYHLNQMSELNNYSNNDVMTVKDKYSSIVIIAIRGTDIKNITNNRIRDLVQDYGILAGDDDAVTRTKKLISLVEKAISKFGKNNVILTGHSLGGFIACRISDLLNVRVIAFNIGSSLLDGKERDNKNIIHYTTNNPLKGIIDIASISTVLKDNYRTITVKQKTGVDIHSINNFTP
jgi:hypothetical protein